MPRPAQQLDPTTFVGQVSAEIRRRRLKQFESAELAAAAAGVPTQTWYHWEKRGVTLAALPLVAEALGCTPAELLPAPPAKRARVQKSRKRIG